MPFRRTGSSDIEVMLVHPGGPFWKNKDEHAWSIAKGELGAEEASKRAAEREFTEEVGLPVPPGPRIDLGSVTQSGGKTVRAWAIEAPEFVPDGMVSNEFEMEWPPHSGHLQKFPEIDRAEWMPVGAARRRLVKGQIQLLDRLVAEISLRGHEKPGRHGDGGQSDGGCGR